MIAIEAAAPPAFAFHDEAVLGTRLNLTLVAQSEGAAQAAALAVRAEIDRLEPILSGWRADSELAALNRAEVHAASPELFAVVALAERWRVETGGAFSGRLGRVVDLWAGEAPPSRALAAERAQAAAQAQVELDPTGRTIRRPAEVLFALDGLAKGWIVDRAFEAAMGQPGLAGALVEIGGEARCGGDAPDANGWIAGVADPALPFDNAPVIAEAPIGARAIATSGQGPRDRRLGGVRYSATLSPFDGWPVVRARSASVVAASAAAADALATALMVLPSEEGLALANREGASAFVVRADGATRSNGGFTRIAAPAAGWPDRWQALATFKAPRRQLIRDPDFRSPYMAMWITDLAGRPVRTLILIGKRAEWQRDNFIWWGLNRPQAQKLVSVRSMSTSGAGVYNVFWDGVDDAGRRVPAGGYILHVETSRERGKHTYRSLRLDFSTARRFTVQLPPTEEGGGLTVAFDRY